MITVNQILQQIDYLDYIERCICLFATITDVNIYVCQTLDRYDLNKLNISFENNSIINLNNQEKDIERWTVDKNTAFQIGWDLNVVPQTKQILTQQVLHTYSQYNDVQVNRFHFDINTKKELDGVTGHVEGDRQYSMLKVTLTTLIGFYPLSLAAIVTVGSMVDPSIGIALASLPFKTSIPLSCIIAPIFGLYAKNDPKICRQRVNQQQWQNYTSNASQFTYDFTTPFQQQYQSYRQQQYQQYQSSGQQQQ